MRQLLVSRDESFVLSAQVALDAHGIRHRAERRIIGTSTSSGFPNCIMVDEADFERATTVVAGIQTTSNAPIWDRTYRRFLIALAIGVLFAVLAFYLLSDR